MVLSIKNNNPGNLRPLGSSQGFQSFATPQEGLEAMRNDLRAKITGNSNAMRGAYGDNYDPTLANILAVWAPNNENDTSNYINFVTERSGLDPNAPLSENDIDAFLPAMVEMEGGQDAVNHFFGEQSDSVLMGDNGEDDLSGLSDEELAQIAGVSLSQEDDLDGLSDEELMQIAGVEEPDTWAERVDGFMTGAADGMTWGAGDEMRAGLQALVRGGIDPNVSVGQAYDHFLNKYRDKQKARAEDTPLSYGAGQVTGAVASSVPAAKALGSVAKLNKYARNNPIRTAAASGGVSGGLYGFNSGEGTGEERLEKGIYSGAIGVPAGAVGASVAQQVGRMGSPLVNRLQKLLKPQQKQAVNSLSEAAEQSSALVTRDLPQAEGRALSKIKNAIRQDFPENSEEVFQAWLNGDEALIQSYGSRVRTLGQGAAQFKSGKAVAQDYFEDVIPEAPEKMKAAVAKNISGVENYYKTADDIYESGVAKASKYYDEAYKDSVQNTDIFNVPEIKEAVAKAYKKYPSKLKDAEPQSIKVLDYAKRVLDDDISKAMRSGEKGFAKDRLEIKSMLVNTMDEASPSYKMARAKAGDYLKVQNSMESGKGFMKVDPEIIEKAFKNSTEEEKIAFKIGVGKQLRDTINKRIDGSNPYNSIFGSKTQRERLQKILSPVEYSNLEKSLKAEKRLFDMRNEILGGSPTAGKQQAALEIASDGMDLTVTGQLADWPKNKLVSYLKKKAMGLNDETAEEVSKILYETDPIKKIEYFTGLSKKVTKEQSRKAKEAYFALEKSFDKRRIAGAVGSAPISNKVQNYMTVRPIPESERYPDRIDTENYEDTPYGFKQK